MTSKAPLAIGWPAVANLVNRMCTCTAWAWRKHTQMIPEVLSTSFSAMVQGPSVQFFSVTQVMSNSLQLHGLQHARAHYSSSTLTVYANSCPLSLWCHPTISSSVGPFSSHLHSFPASGSFPMSQLFASVARILEFQLQHQSFQWIFRTDFL